jgi:hypothetical protein
MSKLDVDLVLPWIDICCSPKLLLEVYAVRLECSLIAKAAGVALC